MREARKEEIRAAARKFLHQEFYKPEMAMVPVFTDSDYGVRGIWMSELFIASRSGFKVLEEHWDEAEEFLIREGFLN